MKANIEAMPLADLKALLAKVEVAIGKAKERERAALKQEMIEMTARRGLTIAEVLGEKKVPRHVLTPWKDRKTGVLWSGRGRYPQGFEKSRAEQLR